MKTCCSSSCLRISCGVWNAIKARASKDVQKPRSGRRSPRLEQMNVKCAEQICTYAKGEKRAGDFEEQRTLQKRRGGLDRSETERPREINRFWTSRHWSSANPINNSQYSTVQNNTVHYKTSHYRVYNTVQYYIAL